MKGLLLDTHGWFYTISQRSMLTEAVIKKINSAAQDEQLFIAGTTLWELAMLESKQRIKLMPNSLHWMQNALKLTQVQVLNIDSEIAVDSCNLPGGFHGDPADRIIVATARIHDLCLVTADKAILRYGQEKYVKTLSI